MGENGLFQITLSQARQKLSEALLVVSSKPMLLLEQGRVGGCCYVLSGAPYCPHTNDLPAGLHGTVMEVHAQQCE